MKKTIISFVAVSMLFLTGCGFHVTKVSTQVLWGTVASIENTTIDGRAGLTGLGVGAVAGVAVGNQIGKGSGRTAAKIAGGLLGGIVGAGVQKNMTKEPGYIIRVKATNGMTYPVVQKSYQGLYVGKKVAVEVRGNRTRIL